MVFMSSSMNLHFSNYRGILVSHSAPSFAETSVLFPAKARVQQLSSEGSIFLLKTAVAVALQTLRDSIRYKDFLGMLNKVKYIDKYLED